MRVQRLIQTCTNRCFFVQLYGQVDIKYRNLKNLLPLLPAKYFFTNIYSTHVQVVPCIPFKNPVTLNKPSLAKRTGHNSLAMGITLNASFAGLSNDKKIKRNSQVHIDVIKKQVSASKL